MSPQVRLYCRFRSNLSNCFMTERNLIWCSRSASQKVKVCAWKTIYCISRATPQSLIRQTELSQQANSVPLRTLPAAGRTPKPPSPSSLFPATGRRPCDPVRHFDRTSAARTRLCSRESSRTGNPDVDASNIRGRISPRDSGRVQDREIREDLDRANGSESRVHAENA